MSKHKGGRRAKIKGLIKKTLLFGISCIPITGNESYQISKEDRIKLKKEKYERSKKLYTPEERNNSGIYKSKRKGPKSDFEYRRMSRLRKQVEKRPKD